MRPKCQILVPGGTIHSLSVTQLTALQAVVEELGAEGYPLFLRLGATPRVRMQPVTARTLLAEIEKFTRLLQPRLIPGLSFVDEQGEQLGYMYSRPSKGDLVQGEKVSLTPTPEGIRVTVQGFPPPAGFRSRPGMPPLHYECYFRELRANGDGWHGFRTEAMGGAPDKPVTLPYVPLPPTTQWDLSRVAGRPAVAALVYVETPAPEVYRDVLHAFDSACNESLRLKAPLEFRLE